MADTNRQVLKARTENHSDVADSAPARAIQAASTERNFGQQLTRLLRDTRNDISLRSFKEEWVATDDGMVHEISVEVVQPEGA